MTLTAAAINLHLMLLLSLVEWIAALALLLVPACGGDDSESEAQPTTAGTTAAAGEANLAPIKNYLLGYTGRLTGFTDEFKQQMRSKLAH